MDACFSLDGSRVLRVEDTSDELQLCDTATMVPLMRFPRIPNTVALSSTGDRVACFVDGYVGVWATSALVLDRDAAQWTVDAAQWTPRPDTLSVALSFSPNNRLLVYFDHTGMVRVWQADTGGPSLCLHTYDTSVIGGEWSPGRRDIAWSPDSRCVAVFFYRTVVVYEAATGIQVCTYTVQTPPGRILACAYTSNDRIVLSVGNPRRHLVVRLADNGPGGSGPDTEPGSGQVEHDIWGSGGSDIALKASPCGRWCVETNTAPPRLMDVRAGCSYCLPIRERDILVDAVFVDNTLLMAVQTWVGNTVLRRARLQAPLTMLGPVMVEAVEALVWTGCGHWMVCREGRWAHRISVDGDEVLIPYAGKAVATRDGYAWCIGVSDRTHYIKIPGPYPVPPQVVWSGKPFLDFCLSQDVVAVRTPRTVHLWRTDDGRRHRYRKDPLPTSSATVCMDFSPDGALFCLVVNRQCTMVNALTGEEEWRRTDVGQTCGKRIAWTPDGRFLALPFYCDGGARVCVVNAATGETERMFPNSAGFVMCAFGEHTGVWEQGGARLLAITGTDCVRLWDWEAGTLHQTICGLHWPSEDRPTAMCFGGPNHTQLAVAVWSASPPSPLPGSFRLETPPPPPPRPPSRVLVFDIVPAASDDDGETTGDDEDSDDEDRNNEVIGEDSDGSHPSKRAHTTENNGPAETDNCKVCLEAPASPYVSSCCKQLFCTSCFQTWVQINPTCPLCRAPSTLPPALSTTVLPPGATRGLDDSEHMIIAVV